MVGSFSAFAKAEHQSSFWCRCTIAAQASAQSIESFLLGSAAAAAAAAKQKEAVADQAVAVPIISSSVIYYSSCKVFFMYLGTFMCNQSKQFLALKIRGGFPHTNLILERYRATIRVFKRHGATIRDGR